MPLIAGCSVHIVCTFLHTYPHPSAWSVMLTMTVKLMWCKPFIQISIAIKVLISFCWSQSCCDAVACWLVRVCASFCVWLAFVPLLAHADASDTIPDKDHDASSSSDEVTEPLPSSKSGVVISSPIRVSPERERRRRSSYHSSDEPRQDRDVPPPSKLPVKERLFLSKKDLGALFHSGSKFLIRHSHLSEHSG